jgi:endoglucanase
VAARVQRVAGALKSDAAAADQQNVSVLARRAAIAIALALALSAPALSASAASAKTRSARSCSASARSAHLERTGAVKPGCRRWGTGAAPRSTAKRPAPAHRGVPYAPPPEAAILQPAPSTAQGIEATPIAAAPIAPTPPTPPTPTTPPTPPETTPKESPPKESPPKESAGGEPTPPSSADPFADERFYVQPNSQAAQTEQQWASDGRSAEAAEIAKIASQPSAEWFGDWSYGHGGTAGDINWWVSAADAAATLPVIVAYDLPWRDCSQYSAGGASSVEAYRQFIDALASGIAGRKTVVILEPDALAELECLSTEQQASYYSLLSYAVAKLAASPAVSVYLDAGNAGWQSPATMAARLRKADVAGARGFSLNVSNFDSSAKESAYGGAIDEDLDSSAHFIIDTSRNGQGAAPGGEWCNPPGRGLGTPSTSATGNPLIDAYFWIKQPGESDGTCNGGPAAGEWWPEYALGLAQRAAG